MRIEIAEPGRMTQSGSSLLKLIQNHKTPVLDLLVRESIQNSLDAHKINSKFVTVEFLTGDFSSNKLGKELEGVTDSLRNKFPLDKYQYLAVCDSNTVGLTGEMDVQKVQNNNYGNLLKLVYEISKPQETEGAGGSWGLGKTVYFRIGIGLVIYYSRICDDNGNYSSRLVASLVENETNHDALIPIYKGKTRRGIAWWGKEISENTTIPETDEEYIENFISIFGITPYKEDKTGTIIIIPYINSETLLENNKIDNDDEFEDYSTPYWYSSLEAYLKIAVQRWYAPRLSNTHYPFGAYLRVLINGQGISYDSMEPVFKTVQALYNRANFVTQEDDFLSENKANVAVKSIEVRRLLEKNDAGRIACTKLSHKALLMDAPNNKLEPTKYFNCETQDNSVNRPVVFFVRKPGMIISYENVSAWTAGIPSTSKNEYIFGMFVLNSQNLFKSNSNSPVESLEGYARKSELADHTSWNDWTIGKFNPRIISKIQKSVVKVISEKYSETDEEHKTKENSELSKFLGDLILPPEGFGKNATGNSQPTQTAAKVRQSRKSFSFNIDDAGITYHADKMIVPMLLKTSANKKNTHASFEIQIDSESGKIKIEEWEKVLKLPIPFTIEKIEINIEAIDSERTNSKLQVDYTKSKEYFSDLCFTLKSTPKNVYYGLDIVSEEEHSVLIGFSTVIHLIRKDVRPSFFFEKEGR